MTAIPPTKRVPLNLGIKAFKRANAHLGKDLNKAVRMYKEGIWERLHQEIAIKKQEQQDSIREAIAAKEEAPE